MPIDDASADLTRPPSAISSRMMLIASAVVIFFLTVAILCGGYTVACLSVIFTDGVVAFAWVAGATAIGWLALRSFKLECNMALKVATAGGLGMGIVSLLGLMLGLLGWLNHAVAIAFPVASAALFLIDLLRHHSIEKQLDFSPIRQWLREPAGPAWLWLIPVVSLAIAAVSASIMPGVLWKPLDPHPYDVTSYHLLVPREWYEGGRIVPLSHNVFSYFPFNVEMQFLLLMHATGGPYAAMYACQFLSVGYAGMMVVGVYGACRRGERSTFNVQRSTCKGRDGNVQPAARVLHYSSFERWKLNVKSSTFAQMCVVVLVSTVPWVIMLAGVAYVESALLLYTTLAIAWTLHAIANDKQFIRSNTLAGILAGLACGVKITAVPMLLLALPVGLLAVLSIRHRKELTARKMLTGVISSGLTGSVVLSPWLIRNFIWCGNPVFPVAMKSLGHDHFSDQQIVRFYKEHSPTFSQKPLQIRLTILVRDVIFHWQYGFLLLPMAAIACALQFGKRETWLLMTCGLFVLVVWLVFTHNIPRFAVMIIPVAALAAGNIEWGRGWPVAIVVAVTAAIIGWVNVVPALTQTIARAPLFGLVDMKGFLMSTELSDAWEHNPNLQIALVGDAQAFLYPIPMSHLHYRSVFNVATGYDNPVDAWIGPQVRGDPNWLLVINPMEVARLHATYVGVPALPKEWDRHLESQQDFFLRGDQFPRK